MEQSADMPRTFELGVYDQSGEVTLRLVDLLADDDPCPWYDDLSSVLIVRDRGTEHLREWWNFGPLSRIAAQVTKAHQRLSRGRPAIIRSGFAHDLSVPWVLFEPGPYGTAISDFTLMDPVLAWQFPDRRGAARLYAHICDEGGGLDRRLLATLPTKALVHDMKQSVREANTFLERASTP
jgi:hypothetical protein